MADTIFGSGCDQWVCPNDRQLALRAKLHTGWSVHTYQTEKQRKSQSLSPAEVEAILQVIQRAERLDILEQQRVGRLVERLETMRRHVMGNGLSQCLLCGEVLGFLGSSSVFCQDCRKVRPCSGLPCRFVALRENRWGGSNLRLLTPTPRTFITVPESEAGPEQWRTLSGCSWGRSRVCPLILSGSQFLSLSAPAHHLHPAVPLAPQNRKYWEFLIHQDDAVFPLRGTRQTRCLGVGKGGQRCGQRPRSFC
ncbi:hypothetical protein FD754_010319 [Muntiacus muntjak]|uniref:RabBD domain-containing protein n=1 Tax=Muntiacus muntjak TaxID=9888 RepID=A0A5N3WXP7_MUNMU|nr:hypothetical protein FD754_010319 [Muntiacus muntjak]